MNSLIDKMNDDELADIYRNVRSEIEENELQSLLEGAPPSSEAYALP